MKLACLQADRILTVSEYSRERLAEVLGIDQTKIGVVPEAGAPAFRRLEDGVAASTLFARLGFPAGARALVYVGGFSPHKNLPLLVEVMARLAAQPRFAEVRLILAGDYQGDVFFSCYQQLRSQVQRLGLQDRVLFPGYMGDADLVPLLNCAAALVLPSFCEGFGLPAVEAAACGTPSVVTTRSPLPQLLGGGAFALDPDDREGWVRACERLLDDAPLQRRMGEAAFDAARLLSWEASARHLLAAFEDVARTRGRG